MNTRLMCPNEVEAARNRARAASNKGRLHDAQQARLLANLPRGARLPSEVVVGRLPSVKASKFSVPANFVPVRTCCPDCLRTMRLLRKAKQEV